MYAIRSYYARENTVLAGEQLVGSQATTGLHEHQPRIAQMTGDHIDIMAQRNNFV